MRLSELRKRLLVGLADEACVVSDMPFYDHCDVCHRDDTEGFLDVDNFNHQDYSDCCDGGRVVGGTLFKCATGKVVCADCVRALGHRGKLQEYGITLSTLILAGCDARTVVSFQRVSVPVGDGRCHVSAEYMDDGRCLSCNNIHWMSNRYTCQTASTVRAPTTGARFPTAPTPKSLKWMTNMVLSSADLAVTRQLCVSV